MPVSEATYRLVVTEESDDTWELVCGRLRKKPPMSQMHRDVTMELTFALHAQLNPGTFKMSTNHSRTRLPSGEFYVPDIAIIPAALAGPSQGRERVIDEYSEPLPLVIEVWSPSTGEYDATTKLPGYMARGDLEIWLVHPHKGTLSAWRRQADGSYSEHQYTLADTVEVASLPGVRVRLASIFQI